MRTWHSPSIDEDCPTLPDTLRNMMFEKLRGVRQQQVREDAMARQVEKNPNELEQQLCDLQQKFDRQESLL